MKKPRRFWVKSGTLEAYIVTFDPHEAAVEALRRMLPADRLGFLIAVFPLKRDGYTIDKDLTECHAFVTECLAKEIKIIVTEVE